jgi:hypothetical protein
MQIETENDGEQLGRTDRGDQNRAAAHEPKSCRTGNTSAARGGKPEAARREEKRDRSERIHRHQSGTDSLQQFQVKEPAHESEARDCRG